MIIDELIDKQDVLFYGEDRDAVKNDRFKAIIETTRHQFEKCKLYQQFCKQKNFDPRRDLKEYNDIVKIPYLTTANFKQKSGKPKDFLCVPESEIQVFTTSSGTSGDPSLIGRDIITLTRMFKSMEYSIAEMCDLPHYDWSLFFQPPSRKAYRIEDKINQPEHHMGYIFNVKNKLPMENRYFALKLADEESRKQGKPFEFDPETTFGFLNSNPKEKGAGWLGGSNPLVYGTLTNYHKKTGQTFDVGEESLFYSGGGWKTYSGPPISPEKFREDIGKILDISKERIRDVYGMTESDVFFCECKYHNKHVLSWGDVIVRDVDTLEPVENGEKGLMNVINPLAHSFAGVSLLQDDIVRIAMEDTCPCGRKGKIVEIFGRVEGSEGRGCGAQIADETAGSE